MTGANQDTSEPARSVLARGLALLAAFEPADTELSLAKLAARTGLPKTTAHRLLGDLASWGAVEKHATGYRLGMRLFDLGQRVPRQRDLREAALPYLEDLYEATHENIHLAVPDGLSTMFLEKVSGRRSKPIISRVGGRLPAHCTATGKIFLAYGPPQYFHDTVDAGLKRLTPRTIIMPGMLRQDLARVIQRGYGVNYEESEAGVSAVAAPVFDHRRRVIASISITGDMHHLDLDRLAPAIRTAANSLSRELAYAGGNGGVTLPAGRTHIG